MRERDAFQLAPDILHKLQGIASLIRKYVLLESALLMGIWCLVIFWIGGLIDYLPVTAGASESPRGVRIGILAVMALGILWIASSRLLNRLFARLPLQSLALLVERKYPLLNSELMTAVELSEREEDVSNPEAHRQMLDRVHHSIRGKINQVDSVSLLNWQPIWGAGVAFGFGMVFTVIATAGMPDWVARWSNRLFALSDTPWPRRARLEAEGVQIQLPAFTGQLAAERVTLPFQDGLVRIPVGAAALLQIAADTQAVAVPEVCTLFYRAEDGTRGRANMRRMGGPSKGKQQFTLDGPPLDGLTSDLSFDVVGLDARIRDLTLHVIDPAVVTDMRLECTYPPYLLHTFGSRAATEQLPYRGGQRIPQGTQVTLLGKSARKLSDVQYVVRGTSATANETSLQILSVKPDGDQFAIPLGSLDTSLVVEIRLKDEYGLASDQIPRYMITIQEDTVPEVESKLEGIGIAITPKAMLPIRGTAKDDHGIASVALELTRNDQPPFAIPLELQGDDALKSDIDLMKLAEEGKLQIAPDSTLGLVVSARDRFDLQGKQHVGLGQPQSLAVVTEDKLLVILDRQELESRQRLEIIISEVQQLRDALRDTVATASQGKSAMRPSASNRPWITPVQQDTGASNQRDPVEEAAQLRRLVALRAQQSVLQSDKSFNELTSIAQRVDNIRLQLVNNRIDSTDRQARLQEKVHQPLTALLAGPFEELKQKLLEFQSASMSDAGGIAQARQSIDAVDRVLIALEEIKANMLDIESFSEIVDLVRGLLDDQEELLNETEKQQKKRILDVFK